MGTITALLRTFVVLVMFERLQVDFLSSPLSLISSFLVFWWLDLQFSWVILLLLNLRGEIKACFQILSETPTCSMSPALFFAVLQIWKILC